MVRAGNDKLVARNIKCDSVGNFPMNNDHPMFGERWKSAKKKSSMRKGENKVIRSHEKLIKNFVEILMWATSGWSKGNDLMNKLCKLIMDFLFRAYTALQTRLFINWKFLFVWFEASNWWSATEAKIRKYTWVREFRLNSISEQSFIATIYQTQLCKPAWKNSCSNIY